MTHVHPTVTDRRAEPLTVLVENAWLRRELAAAMATENITVVAVDQHNTADAVIELQGAEVWLETWDGEYGMPYPAPGLGASAADVAHRLRCFTLDPHSHMGYEVEW